jgi:gamma-glutamylcyclotransferase (GGCT)/AIG2-like uncharacterized protein YtfP
MTREVEDAHQQSPQKPLVLFVYGTLKCGFDNHASFCEGVLGIEKAAVYGKLYDLPFGFPALVVPQETIHATGTKDPTLDVATQHQLDGIATVTSENGGPQAFGELLTFDDPVDRLPKLDHLEGFDPEGQSLYRRVLVPVGTKTHTVLAWTYAIEKPAGTHLPGGHWPA